MKNFYPPIRPRQATDIKSLVLNAAKLFGDKKYLVYKKDGELESLSYSAFAERVSALAESFISMGLKGEKIAVIGPTSPEWIITYLATVSMGSVIIPLDRELSCQEIKNFINKVECKAVVFSPKYESYFSESSDLPTVEYFINTRDKKDSLDSFVPEKGYSDFYDFIFYGRKLISEGSTLFSDVKPDIEKTSAIIFTSGTTGTAKGVMLSQKNLVAAINSSYNMTSFEMEDVIVSVLPLHHTYEMTCGILTPLIIGNTVCLNDSLKYLLRNFQLYKPTGLVLVPLFVSTIYKKIWDTAEKENKKGLLKGSIFVSDALRKVGFDARKLMFKTINKTFGGNLKRIICGGAPMSAEWVKEFDSFGIALCQGYGITECAPLISVCPENENRAGSAGLPVPGLEVMIDREPNEEYGEICVKGPNVMQGYYKDEKSTKEVLSEDGWFRTGDFGYIDEDGFIYITGRKKNVIVLDNGKNVFPEEIEEYLSKISLIKECAVIGRKNEDGIVTVTAVIYPDFVVGCSMGLESIDSIGERIKKEISVLNKSLPSFKQIRGIEMRKNEFDKTTTHKIKRFNIN